MKKEGKSIYKKWWFWLIIVIIVIGMFGGNSNDKNDSTNITNETKTQESAKVVFLKDTNSQEFAEALKGVTEIEDLQDKEMGDSINYIGGNDKYSVLMDASKESKEIDYVRIIALTEADVTNVFMALNRMDYSNENDAEFTSWLIKNIGKETKIKIGDANFSLSLSTSNHPILEMKTDGCDDYTKQQIDNK